MSGKAKWRVPDRIRAELDATGLPWAAEEGKKHVFLIVAGERVGVVSRGRPPDTGRADKNMIANIRRVARLRSPEPA